MWLKWHLSLVGRSSASGWKRAAKCLNLVKVLQAHMCIQRKRRQSIISHSRADIALLLHHGRIQDALDRVAQLYKDQKVLCAYDQIQHYSELVLANMCHVKNIGSWLLLPTDFQEAVLSLMFAASRCGELPELNLIRILFRERFGPELELGNGVNLEMKKNLCMGFVSDDVKLNLIAEIAKDDNLHMGFQDSEEKAEVLDLEIQGISSDTDDESRIHITELPIMLPREDFLGSATRPLSTSTSLDSVCDLIYETSIVYLDDLEEKKNDQKSVDTSAISAKPAIECCPSSTEELLEKNDCRMLVPWHGSMETRPKHVHPKLPEYDDVVAQLKDVKYSILAENHVALDGSMDISIAPKQNSPTPRHGHPKLPEYADVAAQLKDVKCSILVEDHVAWDGSMGIIIAPKQNSSQPRHVHPKLPEYDDVVAALRNIKAELYNC
ncbi:hypothetical protein SLE2022_253120 [Rubroshorea leprosula]